MTSHASKTMSRRAFLHHSAGLAAFPLIVPGNVLGLNGAVSPSNRITMGFVGVGSHGVHVNLKNFLSHNDAQVVAVCDVDAERRQSAQNIVHKQYAITAGCDTYADWRDVIKRDDIDVVVVSTPDHWHVPISIAAVRAGKDVYCEKPLSLTIAEGRALSDAVRRYGRVFQTGSEFRAQANFVQAAELVRNGRLGRLQTIWSYLPGGPDKNVFDLTPQPIPKGFDYDMWLGPAPWAPYLKERCHYEFRWILDYSGGMLTDWGGHLNDQAQWGNNTEYTGPIEIEGTGTFPREGLYNTATDFRVEYRYANDVTLICTSTPRERAGSIRFEGTEGWVMASYLKGIQAEPAGLLDERIGPEETHLYTCAEGPERNFTDCVKTRQETYYPVEIGHRSGTIAQLGNIAMLLGRKLRWDPSQERFPGDDAANRMLSRAMRSPWTL